MAPTIMFRGPMDLTGYDRSLPESQQPSNIPPAFLDAMKVREAVFVKEQGVPLMMEADSDDARCCHWIAYVDDEPVGTMRLVPFPHDLHPLPGSSWDIPEDIDGDNVLTTAEPEFRMDRATSTHDGKEAYVKFGRWAVIKEARGQGIAGLLVRTALAWLVQNPTYFDRDIEGVEREQTHWKGLVCAHAQKYIASRWQKLGFVVDEDMGEWSEASITHVGMWTRLNLQASSGVS